MDRVLTLLTAKDTKKALAAFKKLKAECLAEPIYADKLEEFLPALNAENSCGRGRAFKFLCSTPAGIRKRSLTLILKKF